VSGWKRGSGQITRRKKSTTAGTFISVEASHALLYSIIGEVLVLDGGPFADFASSTARLVTASHDIWWGLDASG
jgi:hypothetical protein